MLPCDRTQRLLHGLVMCIALNLFHVTLVVAFSSATLTSHGGISHRSNYYPKSASWQWQPQHHKSGASGWPDPLARHTKDIANGVPVKTKLSSTLFGRNTRRSEESSCSITQGKAPFSSWLMRIKSAVKRWKKKVLMLALCLALALSLVTGPAFAVTGGRAGGRSFSAPSPTRSYSPPSTRSYHHRPSPTRIYVRPPPSRLYHHFSPQPIFVGPRLEPYGPVVRRGISASDVILVTGAGLAIAYGVSSRLEQEREQSRSDLGPGFSVAKLTVSLNVPDRDSPDSILRRLQILSAAARTDTRKGVQDLISNGRLFVADNQ
jgi:hypothetical protein